MRGVAARISAGHRTRYQEIVGLPADPQLFRLIDQHGRKHTLPPQGLMLSAKLAESLEVGLGDEVQVAILEGRRATARLSVQAVIDDVIGTPAYARLETVHRLLRDGESISGAYVLADTGRLPELYERLKETPNVATVSARRVVLQSFRDTLVKTILRMRAINLVFATIIACGVVYNSARITVAERSRDLASLRVLGYTRAEISFVLLGELSILIIAAIPWGLVCGYGLVVLTAHGYETELFRIPVVIYRSTYGLAVVAVLIAAFVSGLVVRRRLDRLDLVAVLKARE
jgi:putative ABC transport system permease protein